MVEAILPTEASIAAYLNRLEIPSEAEREFLVSSTERKATIPGTKNFLLRQIHIVVFFRQVHSRFQSRFFFSFIEARASSLNFKHTLF
jgi:hypothetical protein